MNLTDLTIHEAAAGLREKKFSSVELTRAALDRIQAVEPKLNAYITQTEELALQQAKEADARFEKNAPLSVIDGVPGSLKDVYCTAGVRTTAASKNLDNFTPPYDATTVKKLKDAGMVMLGKTNTDEYTCGASTESSFYGVTRNPWDTERVAGGSSGG
ncbi:Asp-tRNA(Asn)/Glu-tRNA(Gln) amidotransferase GatCAB subunit A, partial [Candidatus Peregrinibacteria bacterium CG11_big_fil_rev_8_21_14_0_20_46_8]